MYTQIFAEKALNPETLQKTKCRRARKNNMRFEAVPSPIPHGTLYIHITNQKPKQSILQIKTKKQQRVRKPCQPSSDIAHKFTAGNVNSKSAMLLYTT